MTDAQELQCRTHGPSCDGNPKQAHEFVWVKK